MRDYATEIGINDKLMIFERGMSFKELWGIYAVSHVFFLPLKAERLGLPLLEAMATGLTCVATDCTGMKELLSNDRGYLIDYEFSDNPEKLYRDPFGNGRRYFMKDNEALTALNHIYKTQGFTDRRDRSRKYVEARTWDIAVDKLNSVIE